jgi:formate hydrogenlyase subunit 3/multisubunit Na+/H+ antiporter MnhD subunit
MVNPIYIIAILLGLGFLLPSINKAGIKVTGTIFFSGIIAVTAISFQWLVAFLLDGQQTIQIYTAGFKPPMSINLQMGLNEAVIITLINFGALLGAIYSFKYFAKNGVQALVVFLLFILGMNGLVLTRDIFNIFVFLEITSIATYILIGMDLRLKSLSAGFKYMVAGGIASVFLLLGIILIYSKTGTLNLDGMIAAVSVAGSSQILFVGVFILIFSVVIELKVFPANGWALDVYEGSDTGISAMISATSATALLFVLYKVLPLASINLTQIIVFIGVLTFVVSNLFAIMQKSTNRLLGYSSIGQIGLLVFVIASKDVLGDNFEKIFFGLLISHFLAKAGLFWLSGIVKADKIKDWVKIKKNPILIFMFGTFIFALMGFPPFPSLAAKWSLVMILAENGSFLWISIILIASLLEVLYLFRWFGYILKLEDNGQKVEKPQHQLVPIYIVTVLLYVAGFYITRLFDAGILINFIPLAFVGILFLIDFLPVYIKNTLVLIAVSYYGYILVPGLDTLKLIFALIFLVGGILTFIPGYSVKGKRIGFYPVAMMMYVGLIGLIEAETLFQFFFAWEIMTVGSYFLILRGKKSMPHALSYILFSAGGAYLILFGFALSSAETGSVLLTSLSEVNIYSTMVFILLALGFMTKTASVGLHIWLPGAHAEAESDVSPMVSAVLLKAGVFGLIILFIAMKDNDVSNLFYILGWVGAITALLGNLIASFQEDAKKLLAYSSIAQLGYILFALAIMTNVGWLAAIWYSINHFLYKALLFLAVGAIVLKLKTHKMYEMGGLIKQMPMSFISVMIGIIALSGVPPLSGFGGKWLLYNAFILKGWYFQGAIIAFSGVIAFLYLWKLIYSIFLGPIKDKHRKMKEVSVWYLIPQYLIIATLMFISMKPKFILENVGIYFKEILPENTVTWTGDAASTVVNGKLFGVWDPFYIMMIVMGIFGVLLAWLLIASRKATKVKMFNIVYSAERPESPQTTHFSYNMFSHYRKALGFLALPLVTNFWNFITDFFHSTSDFFRKFYNGSTQSYIVHIISFVVFFYFILNGGIF